MLFINDDEPKIPEYDILLKNGMSPDKDVDFPRRNTLESFAPHGGSISPREAMEADAGSFRQRRECGEMLPCEYLVGAIKAPCPPDSTAVTRASAATSVFPAPTSPWSSRIIRVLDAMSERISANARFCAPVGSYGRAASMARIM